MIRRGYLSAEDRADLIALPRDGLAAYRLARRANALVLLDEGWNYERVPGSLFVDDETVRRWRQLFLEDGLEGLTRFDSGGSCPRLAEDQEAKLESWIAATLPVSTRDVGAYVESDLGVVYESCSGLGGDAASAPARIPQAGDDRTQARPGKAAGVHRNL